MANTYASLHYHFTFSTKQRIAWIKQQIEQRVWAYLGGIAKENKMTPIQIGGVDDHVHILLGAPPVLAPSKIAQLLKGGSSTWVSESFPGLRQFRWQDGFGVFSVSKSNVPSVAAYISDQRKHHQSQSYQEEYLELLIRHQIDYDERYLSD